MSLRNPLVTVGMATYNGEEYLADSIRSALTGSYTNLEVLIVDDGSMDASVAIAKQANASSLRIISKESNTGLVCTRQQIMQEARGTYLAWLDQDDISYPNRIASQVAFLEKNLKVGACGSWTMHRIHDSSGKEFLRKSPSPGKFEEIYASIPFVNPISFNTATMRLSAFRSNKLEFREEYGNTLDYDMWSRAAEVMELRNIQRYLGEYRIYPSQTSRGPSATSMLQAAWTVQREVLERNLAVKLDDWSDHIHRRLTLTPELITTKADLLEVGTWVRHLADQNRAIGPYNSDAFERAIGRQWIVCLLHASRRIGVSQAIKFAGMSRSIAGLSVNDLSYGLRWLLKGQGPVLAQRLTRGN